MSTRIGQRAEAHQHRHDDRERDAVADALAAWRQATVRQAPAGPTVAARRTVTGVTEDTTRDRAAAEDRVARPEGPRGLADVHAHRLGRPRARPAAAPDRRRAPRPAGRGWPRRSPASGWCCRPARYKVRANDTDYRFRPDTAHTYFTGNQTSDAVLVIEDGDARCSTPGRAPRARPTSSSATGSTASCGPAAGRRSRRCPPRSASRSGTSTSCRRAGGSGKTRVHRGIPPTSTAWSPTTSSRRGFARCLGDAPGQGRVGGRRAAGGLRHHHPRLRGLVARVGPGARARRALDRGHVLPPRPRDGQRHRLRLDRRRRQARHDAALDRQLRPDHARRAGAPRHGRRGPQPLHRRRHPHAAGRRPLHRRCSASSTTSCTPRRRPASRRCSRACRSAPRTTPPWRCWRTASRTWGLLPVSAEEALDPD